MPKGGKLKYTTNDMHELAATHNGRFLSLNFFGLHKKYLWECACGYQWWSCANNIKQLKRWCPKCAGNAPLSILDMQKLATKMGGKFLSSI